MNERTDVRKTMAKEVREEQARSARQIKALSESADIDINKLSNKDPAAGLDKKDPREGSPGRG